jgi:diamine N-acetyltransferase
MLAGEKVCLRRIGADDLELLYRWENDPAVWQYGDLGVGTGDEASSAAPAIHPATSVSATSTSTSVSTVPAERFSRETLRKFIENQQHDITMTGQLRMVICRRNPDNPDSPGSPGSPGNSCNPGNPGDTSAGDPVGFIDLFDLDPVEQSAGVGVLIYDEAHRRKGYGREALELAGEYARRELGLRSLWCTVAADNAASLALFEAAGFVRTPDIPGADESRHRADLVPMRRLL